MSSKCQFSVEKWFRCLMKFFELCGFHQSRWTKNGLEKYVIVGLQVLLLLQFTFNEVQYILVISKFLERLSVLNFTLYSGTLLITYWTIIVESFVQKNAQQAFWTIYGELDSERNAMKRCYLYKFAPHLLVSLITIIILIQDKNTNSDVIFTYYLLIFMCNNRLMYFLLYVKSIESELQCLVNALHNNYRIGMHSNDSQRTWNVICNQYQRVFILINYINVFFGWSHLATILSCFYTLLAYVNFFYQRFDRHFVGHGLFAFFNIMSFRVDCFVNSLLRLQSHLTYWLFFQIILL